MRYLPVHWFEGMFLQPHHFQAADRHWTELVSVSQRWDCHYNYGVREIKISREALANYQIEIQTCHARMKDGTVISLDTGQGPGRVDLKAAFQKSSAVTVYLAIPNLALGRPNVASGVHPDQHRYVGTELSLADESAGGNDQPVALRDFNLRLALSTDELSGYELLPVARIKRAGEGEAVPQLDDDYIPPLLAIDAWPGLSLDIVRAIYDVIGEKIEVLSQRVVERGVTLSSQEPGDLDDLFMLNALNGASGSLRCLAFAAGIHPLVAYTELCRLVGQLSIFGERRRPPEIPLYDHDDLARIFKWVKAMLEQLIGGRKKLEYEQRFFQGTQRGMQVTIDPKWLHSGWEWYVGVLAENVSEQQCRDLLRPGSLDWKMGSSQQVDLIFQHGIPGVRQKELLQPPRALPSRQGWVYYEVEKDPENAAWKDVLATQTLALRFNERLISNLDRLQGQQRLEVSAQGKRSILQFALFAVSSRQP
ncbi:MAG: type VI secretion system baseplate subunit TssK [Pirellulaceae bacterium]|nr:type VI secretion system baseplate subunit TssK [Pirellulaceae bacterium]